MKALTFHPFTLPTLIAAAVFASASPAFGYFVSGQGHYSLRGKTIVEPGFSKANGLDGAIDQDLQLDSELRASDKLSFFLDATIFPDRRQAYLGDTSIPNPGTCSGSNANSPACAPRQVDIDHPRYQPYVPEIIDAYAQYAFDYCLLQAGRRPRDWGLGVFLNAGKKPFDTFNSVYDGVSCDVNIAKFQPLGFSIGYDKLAETGNYLDPGNVYSAQPPNRFGALNANDDLDQYYFSISYDDRKANAGASFTKNIGIYFADVMGNQTASPDDKLGTSDKLATDVKFLDLYTGLYFYDLAFRNELVFRLGRSASPTFVALGGPSLSNGTPALNSVDSIGIAGTLEYTFLRSGAMIGPAEYHQGDQSSQSIFFDYAYAPGDADGYYAATGVKNANPTNKTEAIAFNPDYKPALILFNLPQELSASYIPGVFDPYRVMNATVFGLGYRFNSMDYGNFEAKGIAASLNDGIPTDVKTALAGQAAKPIGYYGRSLGYELDLKYSYPIGRDVELGAATAVAKPGDAWQTADATTPPVSYLLQATASFHF